MQTETNPATTKDLYSSSKNEGGWFGSILQSPLLWGGLLCVGFYQIIPLLPVQREMAERYFCSHPLEYATAALFFVGIAILGLKGIKIAAENVALSEELLGKVSANDTANPLQKAGQIEASLNSLPTGLGATHIVRRLRNVCLHLRGRQSSQQLEEHLKYLAELASERLNESYALVRTITWAVPILGFLGTVIGITIAIANVTPEQLDSSLGEVTGGLAVAFDTTALALMLSLLLVFASFLVERSEQRILAEVEEFGLKRIAPLFPSISPEAHRGPLAEVEAEAAQQLLTRTESLIQWQTQLWQEALESIRERWTTTLDDQKQQLDESLQQGMRLTLDDHAQQLSDVRGEFVEAFQNVSEHFSSQMTSWQMLLKDATDAATDQLAEMRKYREAILANAQQEEQLIRLESRLCDNLEAVRAAETFEQTLHSLNAAVHLLTARTAPKAA